MGRLVGFATVLAFLVLALGGQGFADNSATYPDAVGDNPAAMFVWATIILVATSLSLATAMLGFLLSVPVIGHASWHAYRDLVDTAGVPLRDDSGASDS